MRALLINGSVGSGKTTTAKAVGRLLQRRAIPHAVIDLDWLRRFWPAPPHDPFANELELRNLATVAANYGRAGAEVLVLAGVIEDPLVRPRYDAAVGGELVVCRLVVPVRALHARLTARHEPGPDREWHLARAGELHDILESANLDDLVIDVGTDSPTTLAARILDQLQ